jgi:hypothetical protein
MNELAKRALANFREAVRPIYASKPNGRPVHIGSAVLLNINGTKVLLTAAHIIDENTSTTLYVGGGPALVIIEGTFCVTGAPKGMRDHDQYDFAFCAVSDSSAAEIGGRFVGRDEIASSKSLEQGRLYTAVGYPNSKNRKYNPKKLSVRASLFDYSNIHRVDQEVAAKLPGGGAHHIHDALRQVVA